MIPSPDLLPGLELLRARMSLAGVGSPRVAIIGGSGQGGLASAVRAGAELSLGELPGLESGATKVEGHALRWIIGRWGETPVHLVAGRRHLYEGIEPAASALVARLLAAVGVRVAVVTNAAGGLSPKLRAGDLMLIRDHIGLMFRSPLRGAHDEARGPRFPDLSDAYDPAADAMTRMAAIAEGIELKEGVYAAMLGPNFETRAEVGMLRMMGADAVGMSTVPETIALRQAGVRVVGLSLITNSHVHKAEGAATTHEEVLAEGERAQERIRRLLGAALPRLGALAGSDSRTPGTTGARELG